MVHCPSCAAGLRFDIETQRCVCDYCRGSFDPSKINDKQNEAAKTEQNGDAFSYICPDCGAELLTTDRVDAVGFCPYCGGASMVFDKICRDRKPDGVIPFTVTKEQCKQAYLSEVKRHHFVSREFRDPQVIDSFRGIYMPYLHFRAVAKGEYSFEVEAQTEESFSGIVTENTFRLKGTTDCVVTGYSHDASVSFDDHLSEKIAPYDVSKQVPFRSAYICGFYAEAGDTDKDEYSEEAQKLITDKIAAEIIADPASRDGNMTIDQNKYPNLNIKDMKLPIKEFGLEQVMYPVWFMSYRKGKRITYATVNGQTGKVGADLPLSPLRIMLAALGVAAAVFALLWSVMTFLPSVKASATLGACALLTLGGVYSLQHFFQMTVEKALHTSFTPGAPPRDPLSSRKHDSPGLTRAARRYLVMTLCAVFCLIAGVSDGSYDGVLRFFMFFITLVFVVLLVILHIRQAIALSAVKKLTSDRNSVLRARVLEEAKRFLVPMTVMRVAAYLFTALALFVIVADIPNNLVYYGLSVALAVFLFVMALFHIRFQTSVAKRGLPQFRKKGAYYDTH